MVVLAVLVASACGGRQRSVAHRAPEQFVRAVYACDRAPLVLIEGDGGAVLVDGQTRRIIANAWRDDDGQRFLSFERVGHDRRQVALEYVIPRRRNASATVLTYDRSRGAHFKVTAHPKSWRIRGEPSSAVHCADSGTQIEAEGDR